jgi:microcystin-dependent protein
VAATWGAGDGSSTFNLPDLRGEFVRGFDNSRGVDGSRAFASAQASQMQQHNHSVGISDPGHTHTANFNQGSIISSGGAFGWKDSGTGDRINSATTGITINESNVGGTANSSENRPRNIAMMYIIKF